VSRFAIPIPSYWEQSKLSWLASCAPDWAVKFCA